MGFLDPRVVAAHCVWLSDKDIRLFRMHDVKVAHNPTSNHFLGSGTAPIDKMVMSGITVGLGTDDVNLQSNVSIFSEMRRAALLQKVARHDAGVITAEKVLEMATIDGAHVLGLDADIGSLEVGKKADVILLDTDQPHWYPRHHLPAVLVFQAHDEDVRTVLIDGKVVMEDRVLHFLGPDEESAFLQRVQQAAERVVDEAGLGSARDRGWQSFSTV
jgi:cytosine/adenosine deaminase-related metal-dependent hydrolase